MKLAILLIHNAVGDFLTNNGIVNFLLMYFDKIIISTILVPYNQKNTIPYLKTLHNKNIDKVLIQDFNDINKIAIKYDYIDIFNLMINQNKNLNINFQYNHFYSNDNKFIENFKIDKKYTFFDKNELLDNGTKHYQNIGLNKEVRLNYFNYQRNLEEENKVINDIINKLNISNNKYNIICEGNQCDNIKALIDKKHINNNYPNVNIHNLVPNPLYLIKLLENAEEIHLIENSHCLMVYYLQYKKIMKKNKIFYHTYSRIRPESQKNFYNMVLNPKLNNWIILEK